MATTSGLYISHRGSFHYVATWELSGTKVVWTAVVQGVGDFSKLIVGELQVDRPIVELRALVRRQVEDRIDRGGWLE
jgi:hypothetical protein